MVSASRSGLAQNLLTIWPTALPIKLIKADGDTLTLEVERGSWQATIQIDLTCHACWIADLHDDGLIYNKIVKLLQTDDIDFLVERYAIDYTRASDEAPANLSVSSQNPHHFAWRVYELYLFVQAVCDFQTGLESAQFQTLLKAGR